MASPHSSLIQTQEGIASGLGSLIYPFWVLVYSLESRKMREPCSVLGFFENGIR